MREPLRTPNHILTAVMREPLRTPNHILTTVIFLKSIASPLALVLRYSEICTTVRYPNIVFPRESLTKPLRLSRAPKVRSPTSVYYLTLE